jgi:two-component system LytT family response regulator
MLHCAAEHPLMRQTLAGLLEKLGSGFVRCHRRAAVQLSWIDSVVALDKGDCELVLRGGARVPCSRQYRAGVIEKL